MIDIYKIKFDANGLVPAIVTDFYSGEVLTLAYMNKESLQITLDEGRTCFYSRSRKCLWRKGETSGNVQHVVSIVADCDYDALCVRVIKDGPACHTGEESCFYNSLYNNDELLKKDKFSLDKLYNLLTERKREKPQGSYTTYLFEQGLDKILKKVGEESTEVIIAGKGGDKAETIYEIADLVYHVLVLMAQAEITPGEIENELANRRIIDHKIKQQKMK